MYLRKSPPFCYCFSLLFELHFEEGNPIIRNSLLYQLPSWIKRNPIKIINGLGALSRIQLAQVQRPLT